MWIYVIDDEETELLRMERQIDWEELGASGHRLFSDSREALEAIKRQPPDILLTDIRMPGLDGLSLAEQAARLKEDLLVIFLTGHGEFEYARAAMRLQAYDYIIKPCRRAQLMQVLTNAADQCAANERRRFEESLRAKRIREGMTLLIREFWRQATDNALSGAQMKERMEFLGLGALRAEEYAYATAHLHGLGDVSPAWRAGVPDALDAMLTDAGFVACVTGSGDTGLLLRLPKDGRWPPEDGMRPMLMRFKRYFQKEITLGVSGPIGQWTRLHAARDEAEAALEQRFLLGANAAYFYGDIALRGEERADAERIEALTLEALRAIKEGLADAEARCDRLSEALQSARYTLAEALCAYVRLYLNIDRYFGLTLISWPEARWTANEFLRRLSSLEDAATLARAVREAVGVAAATVRALGSVRLGGMVAAIRAYVEARVEGGEEVSVADAAQSVYVSASYATRLFKRVTGENIKDYITRARMRRAQALLRQPGARVQEVASAVGYCNQAYFSAVFKQSVGVTPMQYREQHGK